MEGESVKIRREGEVRWRGRRKRIDGERERERETMEGEE